MSSEEIFDKVKKIIVDQLGVAEANITLESSFIDDLGADSLDIVELIMALEEEFDIEIPDEERIILLSLFCKISLEKIHFKSSEFFVIYIIENHT